MYLVEQMKDLGFEHVSQASGHNIVRLPNTLYFSPPESFPGRKGIHTYLY